jgi:hypothetical protein
MIAYLDSSVLLRFVLDQPDPLVEFGEIEHGITSLLTQTECMRAVDNSRIEGGLDDDQYYARCLAVYAKLRGIDRVGVARSVLRRVESSFPAPIGTLDAIHVATALQWRDRRAPDLVFATHDAQQGRVVRLLGFEVIGV